MFVNSEKFCFVFFFNLDIFKLISVIINLSFSYSLHHFSIRAFSIANTKTGGYAGVKLVNTLQHKLQKNV